MEKSKTTQRAKCPSEKVRVGAAESATDRALKVSEVADMLGIGLTLARALIRRGEIASVKIGGARRVQRSALASYLARVTTPATGGDRE
ncbi:MAG: DNA-binding protein [Planctomycetaceae bacterium]|nr:DNA-binding protein [Planctomycetaceae bacterium]